MIDDGTDEDRSDGETGADDTGRGEDDGSGRSDDACFGEGAEEADDMPEAPCTEDGAGMDDAATGPGDREETEADDGGGGEADEIWEEAFEGIDAGGADEIEEAATSPADDFDAAHDTIFHLHVAPHTLPQAEDADEPPASHSSPTDCDTMPSPQRIFVHDVVQFGPMPLRVLSSHSSP